MQPPMRIEAVTVCVGFGDILEHTILANQGIFDRWIIVTCPDDNTTHRVCKRHGIDFVDTDSFGRRGDKFNKGLGINTGLAHIRFDEWVVVLDADILLPARTRWFLGKRRAGHEEHLWNRPVRSDQLGQLSRSGSTRSIRSTSGFVT